MEEPGPIGTLAGAAQGCRRIRSVGEVQHRVTRNNGRFAVEIGKQRVEAPVEPTARDTEPREVKLGTVTLAGPADVRVRAVKIEGGELMRLFSITFLKP